MVLNMAQNISYLKKRSGQVVAEFAVIVSVFLVMSLGCIDYGIYMYAKYNVEGAVRSAVRAAVKNRDWSNESASKTSVKNVVRDYCEDVSSSLFENIENYTQVDVNYLGGGIIENISVSVVDFPFTPVLGFADLVIPDSISTTTVMRY